MCWWESRTRLDGVEKKEREGVVRGGDKGRGRGRLGERRRGHVGARNRREMVVVRARAGRTTRASSPPSLGPRWKGKRPWHADERDVFRPSPHVKLSTERCLSTFSSLFRGAPLHYRRIDARKHSIFACPGQVCPPRPMPVADRAALSICFRAHLRVKNETERGRPAQTCSRVLSVWRPRPPSPAHV